MDKCPWSGKPCPKPKLFHITNIDKGVVESLDLCQDCIEEYMQGKEPPKQEQPIKKKPPPPAQFLQEMLTFVENMIDEAQTEQNVPVKVAAKGAEAIELLPGNPCPKCGITLKEIREGGKLGCPSCYDFFRKELEPILWRSHSMPTSPEILTHTGKRPKSQPEPPKRKLSPKQQLVKLNYKLAKAVQAENYEDAAVLRDIIAQLRTENPEL